MKKALPLMLVLVATLLFTGCALSTKRVSLKAFPAASKPSPALAGVEVTLAVEDARDVSPGSLVGSSGPFADVVTSDDLAAWVAAALGNELASAGCVRSEDSPNVLRAKILTAEVDLGVAVIEAEVVMDIEITAQGKTVLSQTVRGESSSVCWVNTDSCYESALAGALEDCMKTHAAEIVRALEDNISRSLSGVAVQIKTPEDNAVLRERTCRFSGGIAGSENLGAVTLSVNGELIKRFTNPGAGFTFDEAATLTPGANSLEVKGSALTGETRTARVTALYHPEFPPGRRVFTAGCSKFDKLKGACAGEKNAAAVAEVYLGLFEEKNRKNVVSLIGEKAGIKDVFAGLRKFLAACGDDDYAVVYLSGPVVETGGKPYLAFRDTDPANPQTALSLEDVAGYVKKYFNGRAALFLVEHPEKTPETFYVEARRVVAATSRMNVLSVESKSGDALADVMKSKPDSNRDGHVTLAELIDALKKNEAAPVYFGDLEKKFIVR